MRTAPGRIPEQLQHGREREQRHRREGGVHAPHERPRPPRRPAPALRVNEERADPKQRMVRSADVPSTSRSFSALEPMSIATKRPSRRKKLPRLAVKTFREEFVQERFLEF